MYGKASGNKHVCRGCFLKENTFHLSLMGWFHTVVSKITFVLFSKPSVLKTIKTGKTVVCLFFY